MIAVKCCYHLYMLFCYFDLTVSVLLSIGGQCSICVQICIIYNIDDIYIGDASVTALACIFSGGGVILMNIETRCCCFSSRDTTFLYKLVMQLTSFIVCQQGDIVLFHPQATCRSIGYWYTAANIGILPPSHPEENTIVCWMTTAEIVASWAQ